MTDTAQSSKSTVAASADAQDISQQTVNPFHQQQATSDPVSGGLPNKEHAPIEHIRPSDPLETKPEIHPEAKEHGVEARTDEAKLELTREHHASGMSHAPSSQAVSDHLKEEKPEFPMTEAQAIETKKKASFKDSVRWLAEEILRQMKMDKPQTK